MTFRKPQPIADVLARLLARRGYARERSNGACAAAWNEAVGEPLAQQTRPGTIRGGVLEVLAANSTLLQELTFQKHELLQKLGRLLPDQPVRELRFRLGRID